MFIFCYLLLIFQTVESFAFNVMFIFLLFVINISNGRIFTFNVTFMFCYLLLIFRLVESFTFNCARRFSTRQGMSSDETERRKIYTQILEYELDVVSATFSLFLFVVNYCLFLIIIKLCLFMFYIYYDNNEFKVKLN